MYKIFCSGRYRDTCTYLYSYVWARVINLRRDPALYFTNSDRIFLSPSDSHAIPGGIRSTVHLSTTIYWMRKLTPQWTKPPRLDTTLFIHPQIKWWSELLTDISKNIFSDINTVCGFICEQICLICHANEGQCRGKIVSICHCSGKENIFITKKVSRRGVVQLMNEVQGIDGDLEAWPLLLSNFT